jgi:4-amino-4-deoxy-L-arabinose transferase-like glycosyltransferase
VVIVAAGAVLRFATLSGQSFWLDEAIAVNAARHDFSGLFHSLAHTEGNPPLYFLILDGWMRVFGTSEAAIRSLSALLGTATIGLAYVIGRRLATPRVGLVLAALVAFNPLLVWFSQEARPYALLVLLSGLSFLLFAEALERPRGRVLAGWAAVSGLALATHYFAALVIVPEAVWLLARVRPRIRLAPALAGLALVALALVPLLATQGQVQDYSFVKGESLATRVVAQVPKQWLVGYDAPAETAVVVAAGAVVLGALVLVLLRANAGPERRAALLGGGIGVAGLLIALVLALGGGDYYLSRYVLAAWLPLMLVISVGMGARRSGLLGIGLAAALCGLFAFVVVSVDERPELQRDDWRGIARTLGPPAGARAIVVSPINGSIPLGLYLPRLSKLTAAGAPVSEIDAVAVAQRVAGATRHAPPAPVVAPPPGFREVARHSGPAFTVVRYRADAPVPIVPENLGSLALEPGTPDYVLQPPAPR